MYNLLTPAFSWARVLHYNASRMGSSWACRSASRLPPRAAPRFRLEAINKMELTFPMLTSEGAEGRVETLVNTILQAVGDLPVGRRKSPGWLNEGIPN